MTDPKLCHIDTIMSWFRRTPPPPSPGPLEARVEALEDRYARLERRFVRLQGEFSALVRDDQEETDAVEQ